MRLRTLVNSIVAPSSFSIGIREIEAGNKRFMFQFAGSGNFAARLYGTLAYDFDAQAEIAPWTDITFRARRTDDAAANADWIIVGSQYQHRKSGSANDPFIQRGIYALDSDFFPGALMIHVSSVGSGHTDIHFGL